MFGFHVHEKSILIWLNLFQFYGYKDSKLASLLFVASFSASLGLFPLLPDISGILKN